MRVIVSTHANRSYLKSLLAGTFVNVYQLPEIITQFILKPLGFVALGIFATIMGFVINLVFGLAGHAHIGRVLPVTRTPIIPDDKDDKV